MKTDITAEEFFRNKVRELNPNQAVITLANEMITAEQGLRWAHEFSELKYGWTSVNDGLPPIKEVVYGFGIDKDGTKVTDFCSVTNNGFKMQSKVNYKVEITHWMFLPKKPNK